MASKKGIVVLGVLAVGGYLGWAFLRNKAIDRSVVQTAHNRGVRIAELERLIKERRDQMGPYERGIRTLEWEPTASAQVEDMKQSLQRLKDDVARFEAEKADLQNQQQETLTHQS